MPKRNRLNDARAKLTNARSDILSLGVQRSVILVAEDETIIRSLINLVLQRDGHVVLSAGDGQEGLELSRKYPGRIDLVITDVNMPRMNGIDLYGQLIKERPGIKVLVMSGMDIGKIVTQKANALFLPKPFNGETLKAKVCKILAAAPRPEIHPEISEPPGMSRPD
jgi:DNA-binding response OmpR family regulator